MPGVARPRFFWVTIVASLLYLLLLGFSTYELATHYGVRKTTGWAARPSADGWLISYVEPASPAADVMRVGDRLMAIDGDPRARVLGTFPQNEVDAGETYIVELDRQGERIEATLVVTLGPSRPAQFLFVLYSLAFFVCGAGLGLPRPADPQVPLLGATMMMVGLSLFYDTLADVRAFLKGGERVVLLIILSLSGWAFPMAFHFFSRFPTWTSPGPMWRAIQWLLYAAALLVMLPAWVTLHAVALRLSESLDAALAARPRLALAMQSIAFSYLFLYLQLCMALTLLVIARNYRRLSDPDSRRRIRWLVAAISVSGVPWLGLMFAYWVAGWISPRAYAFAYTYVGMFMLCIPIALVVAVWKEQLFDIRVILRRGLQYVLARTALRALLVLPFVVLGVSILSNPNRTLVQILTEGAVWLNLGAIVAIGAALTFRHRLQTALDRRFFREAYELEHVLQQLIDEVRASDSTSEIARLVSDRVSSVLHPSVIHVFYRTREEAQMVAGHSSTATLTGHHLSETLALLRTLEGVRTARDFPSSFGAALPEAEQRWLDALRVRLVVPIAGRQDQLVGLLMLGERMSDEPYSATDRRLLENIAAQIGLVYENQHLKERVRSEAEVRRQVLAHLDESKVSLLKECPACGRCYDSADERCADDGAALTLTLPVERTLDGKYRLERALGRGGMGAVYEATDLRLQRTVAAKLMVGTLFGNQSALRRFEREARASARLDHANITRVHDFGVIGSGGAYLIMERLTGSAWRAELVRRGTIPPAQARRWFGQLLDGLQFAHAAGIVHRDLKPENVMVVPQPDGRELLKIMDFGLAKLVDGGAVTESVTVAGHAMGTVGYMAPEVLSGGIADARVDVFAIGVMVVESLTGRRPFGGSTPQEVIASLLQTTYRLPGTSEEVHALDAVIQRSLAKDPHERYASAAQLAADLLPTLERCPNVIRAEGLETSNVTTHGLARQSPLSSAAEKGPAPFS